jgi:hypothetical protein
MNYCEILAAPRSTTTAVFGPETASKPIDALYVFACGVEWRHTDNEEAGRELVGGLSSPDACTRFLAGAYLTEAGWRSFSLLNAAVAAGDLGLEQTIPCVARILTSTRLDFRT